MTRDQRNKGLVPSRASSLPSRSGEREDTPLLSDILRHSAIGLLAMLISGMLLLTGLTALAYANPDPGALIAPLSLVALLPSAFAGGFVTIKRVGEAPLLCGIVCGGMGTIALMLAALILRDLPSSDFLFWQSAVLHAFAVLFSVLGALAGNVKKRAKAGKRRFG